MPLMNEPRAKQKIEEHGLDALVATTKPNFHYIAGWDSDSWLWGLGNMAIYPADEDQKPVLMIPNNELGLHGLDPDWKPELRTFGKELSFELPPGYEPHPGEQRFIDNYAEGSQHNWMDRLEALGETLVEKGYRNAKIGVDDPRIAEYLKEQGYAQGEIVDSQPIFRDIRVVKTPQEIEIMRKANEINLAGMLEVNRAVKEGAAWNDALIAHDVFLAKHDIMRTVGVRISRVGKLGLCMLHPKDFEGYMPKSGDLVRFDFEGIYEGYWTDLGRSFVIGEPNDYQLRIYNAILEARNEAFRNAKPGVSANELCSTALQNIEKFRVKTETSGMGRQMAWSHVIGLELYEKWCWYPRGDFTLEEGMVFNYETPYAQIGFGGMQLEDTFLVTKDGAVDLSPMNRELVSI